MDMANQFPIHKARPIVYEQRMVRTKDVSKFVHATDASKAYRLILHFGSNIYFFLFETHFFLRRKLNGTQ